MSRRPRLTVAEAERIRWLTDRNLERLGKQYVCAAEDMAIAQVVMERAGKEKRRGRGNG